MTTALVTGAERGIGAALCAEFRARGMRVIAACFEAAQSGSQDPAVRIETGVDITSATAVAGLAARLAGERIDILVHNAGVQHSSELGGLDFEGLRHEYEVNALGPLRLTEALLPLLHNRAKIALITSRVGSLGENQAGGLFGYRMSKAAANMLGICLARALQTRGIAVLCLHPGSVRTQMTRALGDSNVVGQFVDPPVAARGLADRIEELTLATTASFRHANGDPLPW